MMISESDCESHIDQVENAYEAINEFELRQSRKEGASLYQKHGPANPQYRLSAQDGRVLQKALIIGGQMV